MSRPFRLPAVIRHRPRHSARRLDVFASAAIMFTIGLAGCGGGGGDSGSTVPVGGSDSDNGNGTVTAVLPDPNVAVTEYVIDPSATDAAVDPSFGSHYAYLANVSANGKLFLFFPASTARPANYERIGFQAARNGFHGLGLAYPNADVVAEVCLPQTSDGNCQGDVRNETLTGNDVSTRVSVDSANSVVNRLVKALRYLDAQHPSDGWGQFLNNGAIRWDLIRVSGHSQGGGLASYAATVNAVDRVCTFASPADFDPGSNSPAAWLSVVKATDASRFYGFGHLRDNVVPWANLQAIWAALGMNAFGAVVDVDSAVQSAAPSFSASSRMLSTDIDNPYPGDDPGTGFHAMTVVDSGTPLDVNGQPVYRWIWQYNCFQ